MKFSLAAKAVLVAAFLSSCNTLFHPSKKRCYELYPPVIVEIDSTFVIDSTIVIEERRIDSNFILGENRTIVIDKDGLKAQLNRIGADSFSVTVVRGREEIEVKTVDIERLNEVIDSVHAENSRLLRLEYDKKISKLKEDNRSKVRKLRGQRNQWAATSALLFLLFSGAVYLWIKK